MSVFEKKMQLMIIVIHDQQQTVETAERAHSDSCLSHGARREKLKTQSEGRKDFVIDEHLLLLLLATNTTSYYY